MTTPLYKGFDKPPYPKRVKDSHHGLWYERFFDQYDEHWQVKQDKQKEGKMEWVKETARCLDNKGCCGDPTMLKQYQERMLQLMNALQGDFRIFKTTWHFATGLGLPHPVENGFAWHPTLGVPYLAGSGVKGLLRAWMEWEDVDPKKILKWLGSEDSNAPCVGQLICFDAIPIEPVKLTADVMTPHFGEWYLKGDQIKQLDKASDKIPADWHDPVPIPFLAVKPNASFCFMMAARSPKDDVPVQEAFEFLETALEWLGAGAKTATGYGHMARHEQAEYALRQNTQKKLEEQEDKGLSAEEKILKTVRVEFEKARTEQNKKANSPLSDLLGKCIQQASVEWEFEWRQQLADLAEEIYQFQGGSKKTKQKRWEKIAKLRA